MERVKGYISVSISRLTERAEDHLGLLPFPVQGHVQVQKIDLRMTLRRNHRGIVDVQL